MSDTEKQESDTAAVDDVTETFEEKLTIDEIRERGCCDVIKLVKAKYGDLPCPIQSIAKEEANICTVNPVHSEIMFNTLEEVQIHQEYVCGAEAPADQPNLMADFTDGFVNFGKIWLSTSSEAYIQHIKPLEESLHEGFESLLSSDYTDRKQQK